MSKKVDYQEILEQLLTSELRLTEEEFFHGRGKGIYDDLRQRNIIALTKVSDAAYVTGAYKTNAPWEGTGSFWLESPIDAGKVKYVDKSDFLTSRNCRSMGPIGDRTKGFIPVFPYALISDIIDGIEQKEVRNRIFKVTLPIDEIGSICNRQMQQKLNSLLESDELTEVDQYTLDSISPNASEAYTIPLEPKNYSIYMDSNGKKYIKLEGHTFNGNQIKNYTRTGTEYYEDGGVIWLTIDKPEIYCDKNNQFSMYCQMAVSGIRYQDLEEYLRQYWLPRFAKQIAIAKVRKIMSDIRTPLTEENIEIFGDGYLKLLLSTCNEDIELTESYIKLTFPPKIAKILLDKLKVLSTSKPYKNTHSRKKEKQSTN